MEEIEDPKFINIMFYTMFTVIIIFVIIFAGITYDMFNDHRCSKLSVEEFYADKRCRWYWNEVDRYEVERRYYD